MKRHTVILPFLLPRLTDKAAAQFIELLHELVLTIEHRLFSEISKNWAGQPLENYETVLKFIRTTKTETGLVVNATLLKGDYSTGIKVSKAQMDKVNLRQHRALPMWNYTLVPAPPKM